MGNQSIITSQQLYSSLQHQYQILQQPYLRHRTTDQEYTLYQLTTNSTQQVQELLQNIQHYKRNTCGALTKLKSHYTTKNQSYCSNQQHFYFLFHDYGKLTLLNEYTLKKTHHQSFTSIQIINIIQTMLMGVREYHLKFKRKFYELSLQNLCIQSDSHRMYIRDPWLINQYMNGINQKLDKNNNIISMSINNQKSKYYYYSPQKLQCINNNDLNFMINDFYSDLYTIGIIGLELYYMNSMQDLYNLKRKQININQLNQLINNIQDEYLKNGLNIILKSNPSKRIDVFRYWNINFQQIRKLKPTIGSINSNHDITFNPHKIKRENIMTLENQTKHQNNQPKTCFNNISNQIHIKQNKNRPLLSIIRPDRLCQSININQIINTRVNPKLSQNTKEILFHKYTQSLNIIPNKTLPQSKINPNAFKKRVNQNKNVSIKFTNITNHIDIQNKKISKSLYQPSKFIKKNNIIKPQISINSTSLSLNKNNQFVTQSLKSSLIMNPINNQINKVKNNMSAQIIMTNSISSQQYKNKGNSYINNYNHEILKNGKNIQIQQNKQIENLLKFSKKNQFKNMDNQYTTIYNYLSENKMHMSYQTSKLKKKQETQDKKTNEKQSKFQQKKKLDINITKKYPKFLQNRHEKQNIQPATNISPGNIHQKPVNDNSYPSLIYHQQSNQLISNPSNTISSGFGQLISNIVSPIYEWKPQQMATTSHNIFTDQENLKKKQDNNNNNIIIQQPISQTLIKMELETVENNIQPFFTFKEITKSQQSYSKNNQENNINQQQKYLYQLTPQRQQMNKKYNTTIVQVNQQTPQGSEQQNEGLQQYIIQQYETGSKYQGFKLNGMRNGKGKFYYQDGGHYQGQWKKNKMHGWGKLFYQGGKLAYQGNWRHDQFHGYGKVYNDNPVKLNEHFDYTNFDVLDDYWEYYQGNLMSDTKQGRGKIKLTNGEVFQGDFHCDRIQGFGKYYTKDGNLIQGIWRESKLIKILNNIQS